MRESEPDDLYARALRLLERRPYSEAELRAKLLRYGRTDQVEEAIGELKRRKLLDDLDFSYNFASYRVRTKLFGRLRAARDLLRRQVPGAVVELALDRVFEDVDEEELIEQAIAKWQRRCGKPKDMKELKRLHGFLRRRGFDHDLINLRLERFFRDPALAHKIARK